MHGYHPAPHRKLPSDVLPVPPESQIALILARIEPDFFTFCSILPLTHVRSLHKFQYCDELLKDAFKIDFLVVLEKRHIDIGHQCVRCCYLKVFLIGDRCENTRENKRGCFRSLTKLNFLTSLCRYILSAPHYLHLQSHRKCVVNSQRKSSVTAQYASC